MLLGLYDYANYTIDWQVFSHVMRDPEVSDRLTQAEVGTQKVSATTMFRWIRTR